MPIATVHSILANDPAVTALVGDRISPVETAQTLAFPNITLTLSSATPYNTLSGYGGIDRNEVEIEVWAFSYEQAIEIADAVRAAMEAANIPCQSRTPDEFIAEPGTDPGIYRIGLSHEVWTDQTSSN